MSAKKPRHLKQISGTDQPCRRDAGEPLMIVDPVVEIPEPPAWLPNAFAVKEWDRLAPILHANKLLTDTSVQALGVLCAAFGRIAQAYAAGSAPSASDLAQYRGLASEFGLTPMAMSRMRTPAAGPAQDEKPVNRWAGHGQRKA